MAFSGHNNSSALDSKSPFFPQSAANQLFKPVSTTTQAGFQTTSTTTSQLFKPASTTHQAGFQPTPPSASQLFKPASTTTQSGFQTTDGSTSANNQFQQQTFNSGFTPPSTFGKSSNISIISSSQANVSDFTQSDLENYLGTASISVVEPDANYIAQREKENALLSHRVFRDIYNIIFHPYNINQKIKSDVENRAVLLAKKPVGADDSQITKFAFIDNQLLKGLILPVEWSILSDELTINAIDSIGLLNTLPLAIFKAFEEYLKFKVKKWSNADVDNLSIEFLICFGKELYPRLDLNNRIRSRELSLEEQKILSNELYIQYINTAVIKKYQLLGSH